jgi:aminobenzoyl-glutamate transport protein
MHRLVPRLGQFVLESGIKLKEQPPKIAKQRKALGATVISIIIHTALIALTIIPADGLLRGEADANGVHSLRPFYDALVPVMSNAFFISGLVYGLVSKTIPSDKDVTSMRAKNLSAMGMYMVIAIFAAQFEAFSNWSHLGNILAVKGSDLLNKIGFTGGPLLNAFIIVSLLVNLVMGSASAKWALLAPVFVPMMMLTGYSP